GRVIRITAERAYFGLKLRNSGLALRRAGKEVRFDFRVLDIFSGSVKAFFAVNAGLDQIIQYRDRFFVDICHFAVPFWQFIEKDQRRRHESRETQVVGDARDALRQIQGAAARRLAMRLLELVRPQGFPGRRVGQSACADARGRSQRPVGLAGSAENPPP
nr:hypothetical protein [Tanacetum cinerariifolium]